MTVLDTHIWIWANLDPSLIPKAIAKEMERKGAALAISSITVWETILSGQKGRIKTVLPPEANVRSWLRASPVQVLPVDEEVAILARTLQFHHEDPADRFIAATAFRHGAALATADPNLRRLSWLKLL